MRRHAAGWATGLVLAVAAVAGLSAMSAAATDDPDKGGGGVGLVVTVSQAPVTPIPTPRSSTDSGTTATGTSGTGSQGSSSSTPTPGATQLPTEAIDGFSLGGVLYVSGLASEYTAEPNPLGGNLHSHFVVKNLTAKKIDVRAQFWLTNIFGAQISTTESPFGYTLKPGETRTIAADLGGPGQWAFVTTHFTLTPPQSVDGITLKPLTRDSVVVFAPWLLLLTLFIAALGFVLALWVRAQGRSRAVEAST